MAHPKFYIKRMLNGELPESTEKVELLEEFDIYCKELPFKAYGEVKDIPSNSWYDEDGDEEYIPDNLKFQAYEMEVEFCCKSKDGDTTDVFTKYKTFVDYLSKADYIGTTKVGDAEFAMQDMHTGIGRKSIRLSKVNDDAEYVNGNDYKILVFKLTFKVNNPNEFVNLSEE